MLSNCYSAEYIWSVSLFSVIYRSYATHTTSPIQYKNCTLLFEHIPYSRLHIIQPVNTYTHVYMDSHTHTHTHKYMDSHTHSHAHTNSYRASVMQRSKSHHAGLCLTKILKKIFFKKYSLSI